MMTAPKCLPKANRRSCCFQRAERSKTVTAPHAQARLNMAPRLVTHVLNFFIASEQCSFRRDGIVLT